MSTINYYKNDSEKFLCLDLYYKIYTKKIQTEGYSRDVYLSYFECKYKYK